MLKVDCFCLFELSLLIQSCMNLNYSLRPENFLGRDMLLRSRPRMMAKKKRKMGRDFNFWSRQLSGSQQILLEISVVTHALRPQHKFSCQDQKKVTTLISGRNKMCEF